MSMALDPHPPVSVLDNSQSPNLLCVFTPWLLKAAVPARMSQLFWLELGRQGTTPQSGSTGGSVGPEVRV